MCCYCFQDFTSLQSREPFHGLTYGRPWMKWLVKILAVSPSLSFSASGRRGRQEERRETKREKGSIITVMCAIWYVNAQSCPWEELCFVTMPFFPAQLKCSHTAVQAATLFSGKQHGDLIARECFEGLESLCAHHATSQIYVCRKTQLVNYYPNLSIYFTNYHL